MEARDAKMSGIVGEISQSRLNARFAIEAAGGSEVFCVVGKDGIEGKYWASDGKWDGMAVAQWE